tara:strand:+ start:885 stop:1133 length:249 start_codon:yes stop_codon:yes gene_type:complete
MNRKNILSENVFSKLKKFFGLSSAEEKQLTKNKKVAKKISDTLDELNKDLVDFEKYAEAMFKDMGVNRKVNVKKYKVTDFLK